MNLRSLRTRIVLGTLISSLAAVLLVTFSVVIAVDAYVTSMLTFDVPTESVAACEASPTTWSEATLGMSEAFAYRPDGSSANPDAPALPAEISAALEGGDRGTGSRDQDRVVAVRVQEAGPCSVISLTVRRPAGFFGAWVIGLIVGAILATALVVTLSLFLSVRPLIRRIARLRAGAAGVGTDTFSAPKQVIRDDLHAIGEVLEQSHARIIADRAALLDRQAALENHLSEVAHDLRTPLASLQLAMGEVSAEVGEGPARPSIGRAIEDVSYVSSLVDNLHQATRLRIGLDADGGECDLCEVVERLGVRFTALGQHRGIAVAVAIPDRPVRVAMSPDLAERAIANLVQNAVTHGESGGHVAVVLEVNAHFELTVLDDGPGVPRGQLASLTNATFLEGPVRPRGTGLGLAITNEIVRRAGWQIQYELEEPRGLRVTIQGEVLDG